jgi:hypothetical protein
MQVHTTKEEMYRDTTDRRNIQRKMGAMPEKDGRSDQPFTKQNQNRKKGRMTAEQETYNEVHKKQRKCMS